MQAPRTQLQVSLLTDKIGFILRRERDGSSCDFVFSSRDSEWDVHLSGPQFPCWCIREVSRESREVSETLSSLQTERKAQDLRIQEETPGVLLMEVSTWEAT